MKSLFPPAPELEDRSRDLRVAGGIMIAMGVLGAGSSLLLLLARFLAPTQRGETAFSFIPLAAALIVLGVGWMRGRRWARNLTLVGSATSLAGGLLVTPFLFWMVSRFLATERSLAGAGCVVIVPLLVLLLLLILIPFLFLLFSRRRDVRATVERLDPKPGWTDRQPLPLLAAALLFASFAVGWLPSLYRAVVAVPGTLLTGTAARGFILAIVLASAAIAWGLYRGSRGAWLAAVVLSLGGAAFWIWTLRDLDFVALQRAMGAGEEEVAMVRRVDLRPGLMSIAAVTALAWTAYLVWVRRFLPPRAAISR